MNLIWCTITVGDLAESIQFYSEVIGLEFENRFSPHHGLEIAFLMDENGREIELVHYADKPVPAVKEGISLGFQVPDLEETLAMIKGKGITILEGPLAAPTVKFFFIKDPNGVSIQFVEKLAVGYL